MELSTDTDTLPSTLTGEQPGGWELPQGGGDAGVALRAHDWSGTPLGEPGEWPTALQTLVSVMLGSNQPMFLVWGEKRTLLYNSAYAQILADKHPRAMGRDFLEVWAEIRSDLQQIVDDAYQGRPVHMDDIALVMHRNGRTEEAHFSFSYTPVAGERGRIAGFFCACQETTRQVQAERRAELEREQQRRVLRQMPGFAALLSGPDHRFDYANDAYLRLVGQRDVVGQTAAEALPEVVEQGFIGLLDRVFATGEAHVAHATPIVLEGELRYIDFIYHPVTDEDGAVTGIFVGGYDVTEQELGKARFRAVQESSAAGFMLLDAIRGEGGEVVDFRWAFVNEAACRIVGRQREEFIGRRLLEEMPGNRDEGLYAGYVRVVETGEPWNTEISYEHEGVSV